MSKHNHKEITSDMSFNMADFLRITSIVFVLYPFCYDSVSYQRGISLLLRETQFPVILCIIVSCFFCQFVFMFMLYENKSNETCFKSNDSKLWKFKRLWYYIWTVMIVTTVMIQMIDFILKETSLGLCLLFTSLEITTKKHKRSGMRKSDDTLFRRL